MNRNQEVRISKLLSLVLRHQPGRIGIMLDDRGWTDVATLLAALAAYSSPVSKGDLEQVVAENTKQRFAFNDDKTMIRANQGHSVIVNLDYAVAVPPTILYHGTGVKNLTSILASGIKRMARHHVHLSADIETALIVGRRWGIPAVLKIAAQEMQDTGFVFYKSLNAVWLTDRVPPEYISESPIL